MGAANKALSLATSIGKTAGGDVDMEGIIKSSTEIAEQFWLPVCDNA